MKAKIAICIAVFSPVVIGTLFGRAIGSSMGEPYIGAIAGFWIGGACGTAIAWSDIPAKISVWSETGHWPT